MATTAIHTEAQPEGEPVPAVRCHGLTKIYPGGITAVNNLDMTVHRGEIYGLLGPNGAGKSTTIGMLTTRVIPTAGEAAVGGIDVIHRPAIAKQVIGVVPQTNTLDRTMNVVENLEFHGRYFGMSAKAAKQAARDMLVRVRLVDRAGAPVMALSGGMAQRLMVARAILHRPQVLFLDEPTAGLDPQSRIAMWEILDELHKDGQTILLTTHYMEEADLLCNRVAIMDHGRILALDTPEMLKRSIGIDTEVRVSADDVDLHDLATVLGQVDGVNQVRVRENHVELGATTGKGLLPRLIAASESANLPITDLSVHEPTLESVFINLTGKDLRE